MLSFDFIILLSALGFAALSAYMFASAVFKSNSDEDALAWAGGDEGEQKGSGFLHLSRPLVRNFTIQHAAKIKSKKYRESIRKKIVKAGLGDELNVEEFIGLQFLWGIGFPIALLIINFALQLGYSPYMCLVIGFIGAYFPHLYCSRLSGDRQLDILSDMPFFIDMLALSVSAGADFTGAIQRIVEKTEGSVLGEELESVLKDITLGTTRAEAFKAMAERIDIPEVTSFCTVIVDATFTGADIQQVLVDQSEQMRMERFVRAEKEGAKASQKVMIPMMLFIIPAVFIVVFAPVVLSFFYGGK